MTMKCRACRKVLTSVTSKKFGYGPTCLKRAVKAGTAPIEALEELSAEQKQTKERRKAAPAKIIDNDTLDLFEQLRVAALDDLRKAVSVCESVGIVINFEIKA